MRALAAAEQARSISCLGGVKVDLMRSVVSLGLLLHMFALIVVVFCVVTWLSLYLFC